VSDFQVKLWEVSTGKELAAATHDSDVDRVFFSRDGRSLVTASSEGKTSRVWALTFAPPGNLTGATEISRLADPDAVSATADMRYLVTAGAKAVGIWPLEPGELIAEVQTRSLRNLTRSEWEIYLGDMPYRKTCPNLPEAPVESGGSTSPTPLVSQVSPSPSPSGAEGLTEAKHYLDLGDYAKALSPLQKAADAGNPYAMNNLCALYDNGQGVTQDYQKAREWYQKAADGGNTSAMNKLGDLYYDGKGVAQDYGKAREWYQKAADAGNAVAMTNLGWLYENGKGVSQDYGKAREWYQKGADAGNTDAMYNLGVLYRDGKGVAQDYDKAREWYQKAADAGDTDAKQALSQANADFAKADQLKAGR
jgi:Sel1 repeat